MKILVTGGGGFLGGAICRKLIENRHQVRSISRGDYPHLREIGVDTFRGDIADPEAIVKASAGCDAICHTAAKAGVWGSFHDYFRSNVTGTLNVIKACGVNSIKRLVYTGSPSVTFKNADQNGEDESSDYPHTFLSNYPKTKAMAEKKVLESNGPDLATVSLRPHLIWGPGDHHLIPRVISRARAGKLRIVGTGENLVDTVYIDNAADAHVLAVEKLNPGSPIAGKAYYITNDEPLPIRVIFNKILEQAGMDPIKKRISAGAAYFAGALIEFVYKLLNKKEEPLMTRFVAKELSCAHWFDISAAKGDLGYKPEVSIDEGMKRLGSWIRKTGM